MQNNDIGLTKNKVNHYIMLVWRQGMFSTSIILSGVAVVQYSVTVLVAAIFLMSVMRRDMSRGIVKQTYCLSNNCLYNPERRDTNA